MRSIRMQRAEEAEQDQEVFPLAVVQPQASSLLVRSPEAASQVLPQQRAGSSEGFVDPVLTRQVFLKIRQKENPALPTPVGGCTFLGVFRTDWLDLITKGSTSRAGGSKCFECSEIRQQSRPFSSAPTAPLSRTATNYGQQYQQGRRRC
jgi:hypothetical protein